MLLASNRGGRRRNYDICPVCGPIVLVCTGMAIKIYVYDSSSNNLKFRFRLGSVVLASGVPRFNRSLVLYGYDDIERNTSGTI